MANHERGSIQCAKSPCPEGHADQARAYMLCGVQPERCPKCGEVPVFSIEGEESGGGSPRVLGIL